MNQTKQIHRLLKRGWTSARVLNGIAFRYSARILELRQDGVVIEKERRKDKMWYYRVRPTVTIPDIHGDPIDYNATRRYTKQAKGIDRLAADVMEDM